MRIQAATSLGKSGLQDWLIQRVSAVILALYCIFLSGYFILNPNLQYENWKIIFENSGMRYATLLVLASLISHAWIGLWTVTTDYLKFIPLRFGIQILIVLANFVYLIWGIQIIWGV